MPQWVPPDGVATRYESHFGDRVVRCFVQRATDVFDVFQHAALTRPQAEALVLGDIRLTYAELAQQVEAMAGGLASRDVGRGDRVALLLGNRVEFVVACLAAFRLGAIAVPIGHRLQGPEVAYILEHCGAKALIHEAELADRVPSPGSADALRFRFHAGAGASAPVGSEHVAVLLQGPSPPPRPTVAEEDTAVILYTSGTTGRPKGAMLTHFNLVHSLLHFQHGMRLGPQDRMVLAVPASHVTGLVALILLSLQAQATLVMMPDFRASDFLKLAAREQITHSVLVPAMYNLCLLDPDFRSTDLSAWRVGGYGGAPMPEATIRALAEAVPGLGLMNAYGATETTSPATMMPAAFTAGHRESVGLPLHCADIKIMNTEGQEVPAGETGEIWIGGPMVVPGYWNNPEATAQSFTAGYWHSGDIGAKDAEGFVRVFDRVKDMINRGGYKVFSVEVENVLAAHPGVLESAVVARPCPVLGERVHAFVVRRAADLSVEDLRQFCAGRLADYKVPETVTLLDQPLPRNANGKLLKRDLRGRIPG